MFVQVQQFPVVSREGRVGEVEKTKKNNKAESCSKRGIDENVARNRQATIG